MTNPRKIHVGEVYTVKDVEDDNQAFIGAEIRVYWTATSFAQMTLVHVWEDDEGFTVFDPVGLSGTGGAVVESDMRVEILDLKDDGMPTNRGTVIKIGEGAGVLNLLTVRTPVSTGDPVFLDTNSPQLCSWSTIKARAAGRPIFVSEPSWKKVGE